MIPAQRFFPDFMSIAVLQESEIGIQGIGRLIFLDPFHHSPSGSGSQPAMAGGMHSAEEINARGECFDENLAGMQPEAVTAGRSAYYPLISIPDFFFQYFV